MAFKMAKIFQNKLVFEHSAPFSCVYYSSSPSAAAFSHHRRRLIGVMLPFPPPYASDAQANRTLPLFSQIDYKTKNAHKIGVP